MSRVPNASPGRENIEIEIFGMEGIPEQDKIAHERAKNGELTFEYLGKGEYLKLQWLL